MSFVDKGNQDTKVSAVRGPSGEQGQILIELLLIVIAGLFFYLLPSAICFILIYRRLGELEKKINGLSGKTEAGSNYDDWETGFKPGEPEETGAAKSAPLRATRNIPRKIPR